MPALRIAGTALIFAGFCVGMAIPGIGWDLAVNAMLGVAGGALIATRRL